MDLMISVTERKRIKYSHLSHLHEFYIMLNDFVRASPKGITTSQGHQPEAFVWGS